MEPNEAVRLLLKSLLPNEITYNDLQPRMVCTVCDHRGADVRTAWHVQ